MNDHTEDDQFNTAINEALLAMRIALGKSQVCPVCFCGALVGTLMSIATQYEHNQPVPALTEADIASMKAQIAMGETLGSA